MSDRLTKAEAIEAIKRIAGEVPGGSIRYDGLGYRREGVPGSGATFAVSYISGHRRRKDGKNYIQVPYC